MLDVAAQSTAANAEILYTAVNRAVAAYCQHPAAPPGVHQTTTNCPVLASISIDRNKHAGADQL